MADAVLNVLADIRKYQAEFSKIPGFTEEKAAQAALKMQQQMERAAVRAANEARKAAAAASRAVEEPAKKAKEAFEAAHKATVATGGMFGGLTGPLQDVGDLLERVGPAGAAAVVSVAAVATAFAAAAANAVDVARNVDEYMEQARTLGVEVLPAQEEAIRAASEALTGFDAAWLDLKVTLAADVAPGLADITDAVSGLITTLGDRNGSGAVGSLQALNDYLMALPAGIAIGALQDVVKGYAEVGAQAREAAAATAAMTAARQEQAAALAALGLTQDDSPAAQAADLEERRKREAEAAKEAAKAAADAARARKAATESLASVEASLYAQTLDAYDKIGMARQQQLDQIDKLEAASGDHATAELARLSVERIAVDALAEARAREAAQGIASATAYAQAKEREQHAAIKAAEEAKRAAEAAALAERQKADAARAAYQEQQASTLAGASSLATALEMAADAAVAGYDKTTRAGREAARRAFQYAKAFAIVDVAIKTAQAIMNAFTFPTPVGVALGVAAATIAGVTQAAAIASQQPSFHSGRFTSQPDEVAARLKRGEVVVPAPMVVAAGGPERVRERLEAPSSAPTVLVADMGDRRVMVPLRRAVSRGATLGPMGQWGA